MEFDLPAQNLKFTNQQLSFNFETINSQNKYIRCSTLKSKKKKKKKKKKK